ncbi:XRE family transcriptional regulator [Sandaracinobacter sp. RS1-74]|uniref:helix-turn-helix domain-containing protein n=1 Tax=Sandaracinobacteroides sayramensis TaxID=2913411 RepID=UPI001EDB2E4C|nr:XRE family transcriptional regulator [Sandaracinobacteroides sayramensis]
MRAQEKLSRAPADSRASSASLGAVVRRLRGENGWTLAEMSERVGIPVSTLSKIERDKLSLNYDKLQQLAHSLGLPLSSLFAGPATPLVPSTGMARRSVGPFSQTLELSTEVYDYRYLCTELLHKRMIPMVMHLRAKSLEEFGELHRHSGEEFIFVLEGAVEVHTEFYDPVVLQAGEYLYIDSSMAHAYVVAGGFEEARFLGICSSQEEDLLEELLGQSS